MATSTNMAREILLLILCFLTCNDVCLPSLASPDSFLQCLSATIPSELVYRQSSSSFTSVLQSSVQNPKFLTNTTVRPLCIVTASGVPHVQDAVRCGRANAVRLRIRSGGHDYEGLSYRSVQPEPFAVLDLSRLRAVHVNPLEATAWVDAGATLGELYYAVGAASPNLAFPGGACPTVGVSGFLSGGGIGLMMRKYGVGADSVIDARIVDANGDVIDSVAAADPDLFWAIRGGGGESFGVVVAWRLRLSMVDDTVTVVNLERGLDAGAAALVAKWETLILSPSLPADLTIRVVVQDRHAFFQTLFLGRCARLLRAMRAAFPELGVAPADCREMTWVRAMAFIGLGGDASAPPEAMLNRTNNLGTYVKNKSDYVRRPIGTVGWEGIFRDHLSRYGPGLMILEPHGGAVQSFDSTPYPHRRGVLYNIQYVVFWGGEANGTAAAAATGWLGELYGYMVRFVTSNPREAFANYRDLEIGENAVGDDGVTTYESGRVWGEKYFMGNFRRLAAVKGRVDPGDYFRNEQSIPPLPQGF